MMIQEYGWGNFLIQVLTFFAAWPVLSIIGLLGLRRRGMAATTRAIWAVLIVAAPIIGTIAFWLLSPGQKAEVGDDHSTEDSSTGKT